MKVLTLKIKAASCFTSKIGLFGHKKGIAIGDKQAMAKPQAGTKNKREVCFF